MITVLLLVKRYAGNYQLLNEMVKLDPQRFRVVVCYLDGRSDGANDIDQLVSRIYYLERSSAQIKPTNLFLLRRLQRIIKEEKIDLVNCHLQRTISVGALAARLAKTQPRVVATLHGLDTGKPWKRSSS